MAYTLKNTTEARHEGISRPSSTLLHSLDPKAACQSLGFVAWKITAFMWPRLFLNIRGSGWCTENAFTWPIHQRTQPRHVIKVYQYHHQHCCIAQNRRRRFKVWVVSLGRSQRLCGHGFSLISGVLGGALRMPSHDLYIKEHNRGTL